METRARILVFCLPGIGDFWRWANLEAERVAAVVEQELAVGARGRDLSAEAVV